jgi:hypothetical protein
VARPQVYRWALTDLGRKWAVDALEQCQYVGPAPVPLADYQVQVVKQSIANERVTPESSSARSDTSCSRRARSAGWGPP